MLRVVFVCLCLAVNVQSTCYKYEPLYRNWTGTTALSLFKITSEQICARAAQCATKESEGNSNNNICPVETLKPQPSPRLVVDDVDDFFRNWEVTPYVGEIQGLSFHNNISKSGPATVSLSNDEDKLTAMCLLSDDWSAMCSRDNNVTAVDHFQLPRFTSIPPICYVMRKVEIDQEANGMCNVSFAPKKILDMLQQAADHENYTNRSLILFPINAREEKEMCFVSESKDVSPVYIGSCHPAEVKEEEEHPTCETKSSPHVPIRSNVTLFSLRSFFVRSSVDTCSLF